MEAKEGSAVHETAQPADLLLLKEAGKLGSRIRNVGRILQLVLADSEAWKEREETPHSGYDGRADRTYLEF